MKNNHSDLHSVIHKCTLHFIPPLTSHNSRFVAVLLMSACYYTLCWHRANANPDLPIFIYFTQQWLKMTFALLPVQLGQFEPKSSTLSSQDITRSQQQGGKHCDHGKQCFPPCCWQCGSQFNLGSQPLGKQIPISMGDLMFRCAEAQGPGASEWQ